MIHYKAGDLITTSLPYVYALNSTEHGLRCEFCFQSSVLQSSVRLKKCSGCKLSFYCGAECQKRAWKSFHRDECTKLATFSEESCPTETFIFFSRLACKVLKNNGYSAREEVCDIIRSFWDLKSHLDEVKCDRKRLQQYEALRLFLVRYFPDLHFEENTLVTIFSKMVVNSYSILDSELQTIGTGLYLGGSAFDHSCDPNCVAVFRGTTLHVRAIKDFLFSSHKDVFINYVDPINTTHERQLHINEQYYFSCSCCYCLNKTIDEKKTEVVDVQKSSKLLVEAQEFLKSFNFKHSELSMDEKKHTLEQCARKLVLIGKVFGDGHLIRIRMLDVAFDLCIDLQCWTEALDHGLTALRYYKIYYNKFYPAVGILLYKIGKIQHLIGRLQEAKDTFVEARQLLCVCQGEDHHTVQELENLLCQCTAEISASVLEEMNLLALDNVSH